jgi:hypothetical protein
VNPLVKEHKLGADQWPLFCGVNTPAEMWGYVSTATEARAAFHASPPGTVYTYQEPCPSKDGCIGYAWSYAKLLKAYHAVYWLSQAGVADIVDADCFHSGP